LDDEPPLCVLIGMVVETVCRCSLLLLLGL
jgi:hypothetical protein